MNIAAAAATLPRRFRPGFWTAIFVVLFLAFCAVTVIRFTKGLGAVTNLSNQFPWGLWIGFDLLCGVGLAAGAFTLTAIVHLFNLKRFEPIVRPTILTGFLGYAFVIVALLLDLGQPWRIWHAIVYWNPHSVMFEVAWCVMLYTTVLAVEFSPVVFERFGFHAPARLIHRLITPLVILGVILSTLHQSSLGSLYLIVPSKLHPLWYSPMLPLHFYISAIGAGIGMMILESYLSGRAFQRHLELDLLEPLARGMVVALGIYGLMRIQAIRRNHAFGSILEFGYEGKMFLLEFSLGVILPVVLMSFRRLRSNPDWLVAGAFMAVLGFVMNRLNVSITGMEAASGVRYLPSGMEVIVSLGLVATGMAVFAFAVRTFPIFPDGPLASPKLPGTGA
ncbi:formate dehydrogenase [Geothrix limicola]|uniref:Formate dehydrogenase n=1 Tax=Geothrix limicola TaxID=2927978 RepID=A0ABQ5QI72_9BACT|nr:Ni/Fe-hydrogenase cytochrome b subunit [Geothrix limicola]GLH74021.1 formate dehydrogenase [Geothrix limicola]